MFELLHRPTPNTTDSIDGHIALRVDNVYEALAVQGVSAEPGTPSQQERGRPHRHHP